MSEPYIQIGDYVLSEGQAMAVRVAITDFCAQMADGYPLGNDEHGVRMQEGYRDRLTEVIKIIQDEAAKRS